MHPQHRLARRLGAWDDGGRRRLLSLFGRLGDWRCRLTSLALE